MKLMLILLFTISSSTGLLFPQHNEHRTITSLDGIWTFVREPPNSDGIGIKEEWFNRDLRQFKNATVMPVPSAYNELGAGNDGLRNHVGWVWYQTRFHGTAHGQHKTNVLRFGSVQYYAQVYVNGELLGNHVGGHLPFEFPVDLKYHAENVITVAVNNTLTADTIPPADFHSNGNYTAVVPKFDFFNYAGILRPVQILGLPIIRVDDLIIKAFHNSTAKFEITLNNRPMPEQEVRVSVIDATGNVVANGTDLKGTLKVPDAKLWWPRDMGNPYLYTFEVSVFDVPKQKAIDTYREPFGFRTVTVDANHIYVNGKPFYCKGFGAHEDSILHGRGYDPVVMIKDLNMLEWMNANCYRTSHYPYSEQRAYEADRRGIAVITEVPAVGLDKFTDNVLELHRQMLLALYYRDKNHPSTIIWSVANEPTSSEKSSGPYFSNIFAFIKKLDDTRPVTAVINQEPENDRAAADADVILFNKYYGWYSDMEDLGIIKEHYIDNFHRWRKRANKPIIISEYGAEALPGFSSGAGEVFSEQYQVEVHQKVHEALDVIRKEGYGAGEMIWNFADFETFASLTRPFGNHKGVLSRTREPKPSAYLTKARYGKLDPL